MSQIDMFAKKARDEALEAVMNNAGISWSNGILGFIRTLRGELTGEDIRLKAEDVIGPPHHHNAWGAVIRQAVKNGILIPTGRYTHMKTKKSHARMTRVYRVAE